MWAYQFLTILLIFSLPYFPKQFVAAHSQSFIVFFIVFFTICLLPISFRALTDDIKRKFTPTFLFLVFLIPFTLSTIFSIDKQQSVIQLLLFFSYFVIFTSIPVIFRSLRSKELLVTCYLLLVTGLSFISLYNTLIRHYVNRVNVSFLWVYYGHNHLSALLVFAIPLTLYFLKRYWLKKQIRILALVVCCFLIVNLLFSFSIGAMISLAISFLIGLLLFGKTISSKKFPVKKVFFIVFLIITFLSVSSLYFFSETKGIKKLKLQKDPIAYAETRFIYWQAAYNNFLKHPLTGTGPDTFHIINKQTPPFSYYVHNFFIQMLTDTGIFGFLTSITLIVSVLWQAARRSLEIGNFLYVVLFIGILSSTFLAMTDVDWHLPTVFLFFWIFAGLLRKHVN